MLVHVCELCNKITICFEMLFIFKLQWNQLLRSQFGEFWYQYLIKCNFNSGVGNFKYRRSRFSLGSCMLKYVFCKRIFFFRIMTNTMKYFIFISFPYSMCITCLFQTRICTSVYLSIILLSIFRNVLINQLKSQKKKKFLKNGKLTHALVYKKVESFFTLYIS